MRVSEGVLKGNENRAPSCLVLMVVEFGRLKSSRPLAWAELGSPWCCLLSSWHSCTLGKQGVRNAARKGGSGFFILDSSLLTLGEGRRQFGALLGACFINEETEAGLSLHSQHSVGTSCSPTGSAISPLGKGSLTPGEHQMVSRVQAPLSCWESKFHVKNWTSLMKILRKLRSCGSSRAPPASVFSPAGVWPQVP